MIEILLPAFLFPFPHQAPNSRTKRIAAVAKAHSQTKPTPRNISALIGQDDHSPPNPSKSAACSSHFLLLYNASQNAFNIPFHPQTHRPPFSNSPANHRLRSLRSPNPRRKRHSLHLHRTPNPSPPPRNLWRPMLRQLQPTLPPPQRHRLQRLDPANLRRHVRVRHLSPKPSQCQAYPNPQNTLLCHKYHNPLTPHPQRKTHLRNLALDLQPHRHMHPRLLHARPQSPRRRNRLQRPRAHKGEMPGHNLR